METENSIIVANTSFGGIARYINDIRFEARNNVKFQKGDHGKIKIVAKRAIKPDEELLGTYGNNYTFS